MTSDEIKKEMDKKLIAKISIEGIALTEEELEIWRNGYVQGTIDGAKYSFALSDEMVHEMVHEILKKEG